MNKKAFLLLVLSTVLCSCSPTPKNTSLDSHLISNSSSVLNPSANDYVNIKVIGGSGSINNVAKGTEVQIHANVPEEGYSFLGWNDQNDVMVSLDPDYSFLANEDVTLTAIFKAKKLAVTVLNGSGTGTYEYGSTVRVSASEKEGFTFMNWVDENDNVVSTNSNYEFRVTSDTSLTAKYKENFKLPVSIDDVRISLSSFGEASSETSSLKYKSTDYHYSSSISYGSYDETLTFYNDGFFGTGVYDNGQDKYNYRREAHFEEGKLQKLDIFPGTYQGSRVTSEYVGKDDMTTPKAKSYINNFSLVDVLRDNIAAEALATIDRFEAKEENDLCSLTIVGHCVDATKYYQTSIELKYDKGFFIKSFNLTKKVFVIATQCKDGELIENATTLHDGYSQITYNCNKLSGEKQNYPANEDQRAIYYISDYKISGLYYENQVTRYFNFDSPIIWKGANIRVSDFSMIKESIVPSTYLEKNSLRIISSSDETVLKLTKGYSGGIYSVDAVGIGKSTLTFESESGVRKQFEFEVKEYLPPVSFSIVCEDSVEVNEEIKLTTELKPISANPEIIWSVDDESKAQIITKSDGVYLKGISSGKVVINAKSKSNNNVTATKTVMITNGKMTIEQLSEELIGSWVYGTKEKGFTFTFNADGTFSSVDTYRGGYKINCTGTYVLTDKFDTTQTHNFRLNTTIHNNYYVVEISNIVIGNDDTNNAYKIVMHFAMSPIGTEILCHINVDDGNSIEFKATKI